MIGTPSSEPTMSHAMRSVVWSILSGVHTALPGTVESYESATQKASIKPQIKKNFLDGTELSLPVIANVPIIFPRTAKASLTFPIEKGDKVLLIFCERSLDEWLSKGTEVKPQDRRKFALSDAVAIPGLYDFGSVSPSDGESATLQYNDSKVTIKKNGDVEIGETSLKKLVNEEFVTMFNNHQHNFMGFVGTGTPTPGVTTTPVSQTAVGAPQVPLAPGTVYLGETMGDEQLTSKVKAQ